MTDTPMVTDEDREIARRWLSEGQINVDQMGRAAVLVAIRQEYRAALAEQKEACARVAEKYGCGNPDCAECYGNIIAAAIRARASATPSPADAKQKQP